jgi:uncharacterized membrane protein YphA (DoxX/SURF4 family)
MEPQTFSWKKFFITLLRVGIGWHFFYEGLSKLLTPEWTATGFLADSTGFLNGFYHWMASSPALMQVVDIFNIYGLILIGLGLFFGVLTRFAAGAGILLLSLYYFAYPPFGMSLMMQSEGSLYIINGLFIEAMALSILLFLKEKGYGIENLLRLFKTTPIKPSQPEGRREAIKNLATLPALGLLGWGAMVNRNKYEIDAMSGATLKLEGADLSKLKGTVPKGKIGKFEMSRLVLGGNLIGGWAHSRDLAYVSNLFKAYNTEKKVFETLMIAEEAGINTINIGFVSNKLMWKYKKLTGSKITVISQVAPNMETGDYYEQINGSIDLGADIIQIQGNQCDWMVRDNRIDVLEKMMERIRSQGYTAGLASHSIEALIACEEQGLIPDYYMKTMHHDQYWSAHPREFRVPFEVDGKKNLDHNKWHDNCFCLFPERTVDFVNRTTVPVMGFKVLAAGAITPKSGFRWAFENGADFICVGMFDFQIVDDVNLTIDILNDLPNRQRKWFA